MNPLVGAMLILICIAVCQVLWTARQGDFKRASIEADNISAVLTQDIQRNLELYDLSIQGALENVANPAVMAAPKDLRQLILFDRAATASFVGKILIVDRNGDVLADSTTTDPAHLNYSDRDWFRIHADRDGFGLFVSRPFTARSEGGAVIAMSRRFNRPDGSFGGVVAGTLRLDYFHRLFGTVKLGPGDSLSLFRNDGTVVMREPYEVAQVGLRIRPQVLFDRLSQSADGEYEATSAVDGVRRLYHFRRIGMLPLVQSVGFSIEDIYAQWNRRALLIIALMLLSCLLITALTIALGRELNRRAAAEADLLQLVDRDGLTGVANRRCFDRTLASEWLRAARQRLPVAVLMIDADQFKLFNDSLGHAAGDDVLRRLAQTIAACIRRPGDLAARFGGEEFVALLPNTDAAGAVLLAEMIRQAVWDLGIAHPRSAVGHFTVSVGVASLVPDAHTTAEILVVSADEALYRSKAAGRNRVTCQTPVPVPLRLVS